MGISGRHHIFGMDGPPLVESSKVLTLIRGILPENRRNPAFQPWQTPSQLLPLRTAFGALAQLVERFVRNEEVSGSTPLSSTNPKREKAGAQAPAFLMGKFGRVGFRVRKVDRASWESPHPKKVPTRNFYPPLQLSWSGGSDLIP
jgi:hypothetical protein